MPSTEVEASSSHFVLFRLDGLAVLLHRALRNPQKIMEFCSRSLRSSRLLLLPQSVQLISESSLLLHLGWSKKAMPEFVATDFVDVFFFFFFLVWTIVSCAPSFVAWLPKFFCCLLVLVESRGTSVSPPTNI